MKKDFIKFLGITLCLMASFSACTNDVDVSENAKNENVSMVFDEQSAMTRFAEILSSATYERKDVREFLKKEALLQFDKNYDVLYVKVKDENIGSKIFKEVLANYSKEGELEMIEKAVPTLNIYVVNIPALNVKAEDLDCNSNDIPIALPGNASCDLYVNGKVVDSITDGQVPGFNLFVINKNKRVTVNASTRSGDKLYEFIDEEYDGLNQRITRSIIAPAQYVGTKAIQAYRYFYKDDGSRFSKALQRDYIYYGMTPTSTKGSFNKNVTEYMFYIQVDPKAYFKITDKKATDQYTDDPEIKKKSTSRKKRDFTTEELIKEFWTEGAYNFRIEIMTSASSTAIVKRLAVKPQEIWNFNLDRSYRHSTVFRHSKYTYTIDPNKFTAKTYFLEKGKVSFGKWDLSNEGYSRRVSIVEEDPGTSYTEKYTFETVKATSSKINGDVKLGLGIGGTNISTDIGAEGASSVTQKVSREISVTHTNKDDDLGSEIIYFYDPIIEKDVSNASSGNTYIVKEYGTGIFSFGITAM